MSEAELIEPPVALPTLRQILIGSGVGSVVAALALVFFILPAELGIDVTGFGEATGLTGLAQTGPVNIYLERGKKRTNVLLPRVQVAAAQQKATLRADAGKLGATVPADAQLITDHFEVELQPYEAIEMKYQMNVGQPMIFTWRATKPLHVDMHSFPFVGGQEATESYLIADNTAAESALYKAQFNGMHGWYWQNQNLEPVTVTVDATGPFAGSKTWNMGIERDRALNPQ